MHNRIKLHAFFFGKNNERKGKSMIVQLIENIYQFLWGEWIHVPLPGGGSLGLSLLIILLLPAGIVFTIKTRFLPIRLFPDMVKALTANNKNGKVKKQSFFFTDLDRINSNTCRNGEFDRSCRSNIRRWSRGRILDVDHSIAWIIDSLYRSNSCTVT